MGELPYEQRPRDERLRFRLLGPLEVFGADGPVSIRPGRQEVVLAALLLHSNRIVRTDHLVDVLWDENPPDTARTQVQICVSRIRKALAAAGSEASVVTRPPGYLLQVDDASIDLTVFNRLTADARALVKGGRPAEAAETLRHAVGIWRGICLSGISSKALERTGIQLDEERLAATETYLQLELDLGWHTQLIAELGRMVREYPLRDRFRGQLMLALHRSGRQAEALETYRAGRTLLRDELGLEPSQDLRNLERAILADDPALRAGTGIGLNLPSPGPQGGASAPAAVAPRPPEAEAAAEGKAEGKAEAKPEAIPDAEAGAEAESEYRQRDEVPHQLLADTADFVGDDAVIAQTEAVLRATGSGRAMGIVAIVGRPGIGKTTLATHIAHRLSDEYFPDGQLYCDLRGVRPDPLNAREVLGRFLRALAIPGSLIPDGLDERAEMYRSLLATRRMLVVLDDAADEAQVGPLLPGSRSCAVLVTSRNRLTGLPGTHRVTLDILDTDRALELIGNVVGHDRVARESEAAKALIRAVGGLPLALRILAARLAARPHWSLASMLGRLADERGGLDELAHGEMRMRASLSLTHDGLGRPQRQLLCLLSLAQGSTLPGWLAGALVDDRRPDASDLLEPLVDVQMLDVVGVDAGGHFRYRFHEIIRLFARERLAEEIGGQQRQEALRRMFGGWLALAERAGRKIFGTDYLRGGTIRWQPPESHVRELLADPMEWLDRERENLGIAVEHAARTGEDEVSWELAVSLVSFFEARGYLDVWARTHRKALSAVRQAGNRRGHAAVLGSLGTLYLNRRQLGESRAALTESQKLFEELADPKGLALCRRDLAFLERVQGNDDKALLLYDQARRDFDRAGDHVGRASVLTQSADIWLRQGHTGRVLAQLEEALEIYRASGYLGGQARALQRVGQVHQQRGELTKAEQILTDVLAMVSSSGDVIGEGHLLHDLGRVNVSMGRPAQAEDFFTRALSVREEILDHSGVASVSLDLAALLLLRGDRRRQADRLLEAAVPVFRKQQMARELKRAEELMAALTGQCADGC
ncbi:AfsR/SARP family transcriptional regulator [Actinacidiphila sp. bgisy145]|uniref:AfsR/SARP family transcriptional regulator n=1 Tax=Actinacidiphila sp. bgisy145 TaxID=3413792 RepID=UPI003EBEE383